jgi:hypothetical protein
MLDYSIHLAGWHGPSSALGFRPPLPSITRDGWFDPFFLCANGKFYQGPIHRDIKPSNILLETSLHNMRAYSPARAIALQRESLNSSSSYSLRHAFDAFANIVLKVVR